MKVRGYVEELAEEVHGEWVASRRAEGVRSRLSPWGEELMRPWQKLSERAKDDNRAGVLRQLAAEARVAKRKR
jgi:hypothetical protein